MANRFLETNYYKSPFVRSLKGAIKGLYSFIICDCTPSGIWAKDLEIAGMYIGFSVTEQDFIENFIETGKAIDIGGNKFFFPDFIEHQYPKGLQENNAAHKNIIFELKKYSLLDDKNKVCVKKKVAPSKPLYRAQGYGNGNGQGVGNGNGNGNGEPEFSSTAIVPQMITLWYKTFPLATRSNTDDLPAMQKILAFILKDAGEGNLNMNENQYKILNTLQLVADEVNKKPFWVNKPIKSIANNLQEFYNNIKNPVQINGNKNGTKQDLRSSVQAEFNKRYGGGGQTGD